MLGRIPSAPKRIDEEPDWLFANGKFGTVGPTDQPPSSASCRDLIVDVLNQGGAPTCVEHAGFQAIRASHVRAGVTSPVLGSRLFGSYIARLAEGTQRQSIGTSLRSFFDALNTFGFCAEQDWPYTDLQSPAKLVNGVWQITDAGREPYAQLPSARAFRDAFDQRTPTTYRRIVSTGGDRVLDVQRAIANGFPVVIGTSVSKRFTENDLGVGPIDPPMSEPIAGGHAMLLVDYMPGDDVGVLNSWGTSFGYSGYCRFSWDYILWDATDELWTVEHAPVYS